MMSKEQKLEQLNRVLVDATKDEEYALQLFLKDPTPWHLENLRQRSQDRSLTERGRQHVIKDIIAEITN